MTAALALLLFGSLSAMDAARADVVIQPVPPLQRQSSGSVGSRSQSQSQSGARTHSSSPPHERHSSVHRRSDASLAPVAEVGPARLGVTTAAGRGALALYGTTDWTKPQPDITRAIVMFHGLNRNAGKCFQSGLDAVRRAGNAGKGTAVFAPQFLEDQDWSAHGLEPTVLRWSHHAWEGGGPASAPAPLSPFDALDALLERLADRAKFPKLAQVVLAGHSAGGQLLQRYAVVGRGEEALRKAGLHLRYVVANASSYVYFSPERPLPVEYCPEYDRWKYGVHNPPPYLGQIPVESFEDTYVHRDVLYMLGTNDTDPLHSELDMSCAAEAQGKHRYARGHAYIDYLRARHPAGIPHRVCDVVGVGHDEGAMFRSDCGMAALFN